MKNNTLLFIVLLLVVPFLIGVTVGFLVGWAYRAAPIPESEGVEYVTPHFRVPQQTTQGDIVI